MPPDFQRLFEGAPSAYLVISPQLAIIGASDAYLRATMTRREDIVGRPLFEVFPDNPEDPTATGVARLRASLGRVIEHLRSDAMAVQKYDIRRPADAGGGFEERYWKPVNMPVLGERGELLHILHHVEDVTPMVLLQKQENAQSEERQRLQVLAELNNQRLASAVESIEEAIALFDAEDRLVLCNSAYRRLLGEAVSGPLVGRSYEDLLDAWMSELVFGSEEARAQFRANRIGTRRTPTPAFDVSTREGRSLRVRDRRTPEGGLVKTIWDVTDDMRLNDELRDARTAADAANAAKSEFLSSMSHELRTPLNAVLGFAQLLQRDKRDPLSDRNKARIDQILKGGEHLLRLIDDVLDLSRIEAGRVSISSEPVGVAEVVNEVHTTLGRAAANAGVSLDLAPLPHGSLMIVADRTRFLQILMNYGSNAIKYNKAGGSVLFEVSRPGPERVRVTVSDTGMGIPVDKQDKVFQPFQRAGQEAGPIEGTGIGLTISKRLAELMHGTVGFASAPSRGSEFWVELPAHAVFRQPETSPPPRDDDAPRLSGDRRGLIVYVEDNPANVTFMRDVLDVFDGIELVTAPTAELGIELAVSRRPNVIILDINLPGMSGIDALRVLRDEPTTREIPVIALTAAASERDRMRGEKAGFYRYLTKPINVTELEGALEALFSQANEAHEAGQADEPRSAD